jgi:tRNA uridine 5-carbamoylmethylation protein Kti12
MASGPKKEVESISTLEIKPQGLGACVGGNFLTVPKYQRAFSWDDENVANFLADVNTAFTDGAPEYFMGSVVLQGTDQKYEVVDGQQRLTMATVFVAAARDFVAAKGMADVAKSLEAQFLLTKDTWTQQVMARLSLSVYDNDFYLNRILQSTAVEPTRESHERLLSASTKCRVFIEDMSKHFNNWFERLAGIVQYLEHKARVIQVVVPSHANAYVIFETLNDRGKDLSASDLLKNHLFGRAEDRIDEVQTKWNQMLGTLEPHGGDDIVITYIRQLWSATREVAREKELFSKIKEKIASPQQAVDFAGELVSRANHYSALLNSAHPLWKQHGPEAEAIIESLNTLKVERFRPAMLALLEAFESKELVAAMGVILNGSVRYLIAIGAGGGTLEAAWSDVARRVSSKEVKTAVAFAKEMQKIVPNDEVFRTGFKSARISKSFLARYFLASLERFARGEANSELVPNSTVTAVNLEHVLPETPGNEWKELSADIAGAYSRRIGNLVLLSSKKNSELGNQGFAKKKAVLAASEFLLTKEVGAMDSWGPAEIEARQAALAEMALKVWSYKA